MPKTATPQPVTVNLGGHTPEQRAEIEARRGIVRNEKGQIIRDKEWLEARIAHLKVKIGDFEQRIENAKVEISERTKELKIAKNA